MTGVFLLSGGYFMYFHLVVVSLVVIGKTDPLCVTWDVKLYADTDTSFNRKKLLAFELC